MKLDNFDIWNYPIIIIKMHKCTVDSSFSLFVRPFGLNELEVWKIIYISRVDVLLRIEQASILAHHRPPSLKLAIHKLFIFSMFRWVSRKLNLSSNHIAWIAICLGDVAMVWRRLVWENNHPLQPHYKSNAGQTDTKIYGLCLKSVG